MQSFGGPKSLMSPTPLAGVLLGPARFTVNRSSSGVVVLVSWASVIGLWLAVVWYSPGQRGDAGAGSAAATVATVMKDMSTPK